MSERILILLIILLPSITYSQRRWNQPKYEGVINFGVTNFLGELGGADGVGSDFLKDMELAMTHGAVGIGIRYKLTELTSFKGTLTYGMVRGDDALTNNKARNARNIHFRSPIIEIATQFEYVFIKEKNFYRYGKRKIKGSNFFQSLTAYTFVGLGVFGFNPKAQVTINGNRSGPWLALQPYNTEGQGLPGRGKPYSRVNISIPIGVGFKYRVDGNWSVGFELGVRKTFTDYIDDVSTTYWIPDSLSKYYGENSALLSNPGGENLLTVTFGSSNEIFPQTRGDPKDNDSYIFFLFNINKKLRKTRSFSPRLR